MDIIEHAHGNTASVRFSSNARNRRWSSIVTTLDTAKALLGFGLSEDGVGLRLQVPSLRVLRLIRLAWLIDYNSEIVNGWSSQAVRSMVK